MAGYSLAAQCGSEIIATAFTICVCCPGWGGWLGCVWCVPHQTAPNLALPNSVAHPAPPFLPARPGRVDHRQRAASQNQGSTSGGAAAAAATACCAAASQRLCSSIPAPGCPLVRTGLPHGLAGGVSGLWTLLWRRHLHVWWVLPAAVVPTAPCSLPGRQGRRGQAPAAASCLPMHCCCKHHQLMPACPCRCPCSGYISAHLNPATCLALWVIGKVREGPACTAGHSHLPLAISCSWAPQPMACCLAARVAQQPTPTPAAFSACPLPGAA